MDILAKQPNEKFTIQLSYSNNLSDGETINSYDLKAYLNNVITDDVIESSTNDTTNVYVKLYGGISGLDYKITCIITTSNVNYYEKDVVMKVRDL